MSARPRRSLARGAARRTVIGISVVLAVIALGWLLGQPGPMDFAGGNRVAVADYAGADPTGVPAAMAQADVVQRGEYLARAADCVVCHTAHDGPAFAGGLAFNLPFGTLYSTNITPDEKTGIGGYSDEQFLAAVRRGIRKDGTRLYPAMPFTSYAYMTDADVLAIKAYLFSLKPVVATALDNTLGFPFDQRWTLGAWALVFSTGKHFEARVSRSDEWNRGAYLAEALAHCGECHTPRNVAFALNNRLKFGGTLVSGWKAYNVSPDRGTGIGTWRGEELVSYLSSGHAPGRGSAAGPMAEAVDDSFSHLSPGDIQALVVYLRSVPVVVDPGARPAVTKVAPESHKEGNPLANVRGKALFAEACASCHGWSGIGTLSPNATLTGARSVNDPKATNVAQVVLTGVHRTSPADAASMPSFGNSFTDAEIAAVSNFVTARFGGSASSLKAEDVAALRH
ncbi:c-type cytochrome [Variovorax sp. GT1P44]|uniref:c-type cytochrome n=1 Tax=Variovorax sp. GT1P44 TaxID=3443742 RepID=UPI003F45B497